MERNFIFPYPYFGLWIKFVALRLKSKVAQIWLIINFSGILSKALEIKILFINSNLVVKFKTLAISPFLLCTYKCVISKSHNSESSFEVRIKRESQDSIHLRSWKSCEIKIDCHNISGKDEKCFLLLSFILFSTLQRDEHNNLKKMEASHACQ
jgi:hypothetical protein